MLNIIQRVLIFIAFSLVLSGATKAGTAHAETRVAFVVGNSAYKHFGRLKNPGNDAEDVSKALKAAGFIVVNGHDLTKQAFEEKLKAFLRQLNKADVGLFYYSGHAVQVAGKNYLVPVDAKLDDSSDLELEAFDLSDVHRFMAGRVAMQLLFLDACRDNPFAGKTFNFGQVLTRGQSTRGLALMRANAGTLIAFSTDPDTVALDGKGRLSPFTGSFVKHVLTPGLEVRQLLTKIRTDVRNATGKKQTPWENSSLVDEFYFVPPRQAPSVAKVHKVDVPAGARAAALNVPVPYQPEGDELAVTFNSVPKAGDLLVDGEPIKAGMKFSANQMGGLAYRAGEAAAGNVWVVDYDVNDPWGNKANGVIILAVQDAGKANAATIGPDSVRETHRTALQQLRRHIVRAANPDRTALVGVGPSPLKLVVPKEVLSVNEGARIQVAAVTGGGKLRAGARHVGSGELITLDELALLAFEPAISSAGEVFRFNLIAGSPSGLRSRPVPVTINVELHPCDAAAGEPFDLQGVSNPGVRSAYIQVKDATVACQTALLDYPQVSRFIYQFGRTLQAAGSADKAIKLFELAASRGHIRANTALGLLHAFGGHVDVNPVRAVEYFRTGTENGDPYAMHQYGKRVYHGKGTKQDRRRGLTMLLQAAELGHTFSMNELGWIFTKGDGVKKDPVRAVRYFAESARREDIYGYNNMGVLYLRGFGVDRDYEQAFGWFKKAHEGGHPYAGTNIGRLYYNGWGVPKNLETASLWYELSADRGDAWAAHNRAWLARFGPEALRDIPAAARFYALAAILEQDEPSKKAEAQLAKFTSRQAEKALVGALRDLGIKLPGKAGRLNKQSRRAMAKLLKAAGMKVSRNNRQNLKALMRLRWLKSKPRFDLF